MDKFKQNIDAIRYAVKQHGLSAYLRGDFVKFLINKDEQFNRSCLIEVVINKETSFDVDEFYKSLLTNITISSQIENSEDRYCIVSDAFVIDFILVQGFDPNKHFGLFSDFTMDALFYDIGEDKFIDPTGRGTSDFQTSTIKTIHEKWTINTLLGFAIKYGTYDKAHIDPEDDEKLHRNILSSAKLDSSVSIPDKLQELFLSAFPGNAIKFFINRFDGGSDWLFSNLIDLLIKLHVAIPEDMMAENVITEKKINLINVYNEFFLFEKKGAEAPLEKKKRLTTTLRLLIDTPTLNIEMPYIDRVSAISSSLFASSAEPKDIPGQIFSANTGVSLFSADCPPYGCPPCSPESCNPPCCCCATVDIFSRVKANCHEQIVLSCNSAGDGPGPGPCNPSVKNSCFPDGCERCEEACDFAQQGVNSPIKCAELENQDWWTIPNAFAPCECFCREGFELPDGECSLTCVKCNNLFCESIVTVSADDCNYNMNLRPSEQCSNSGSTCQKCNDLQAPKWYVVLNGDGEHVDQYGCVYTKFWSDKVLNTNTDTKAFDPEECTWSGAGSLLWPFITGTHPYCNFDWYENQIPEFTKTTSSVIILDTEILLEIEFIDNATGNPSGRKITYSAPFSGDCTITYEFDPQSGVLTINGEEAPLGFITNVVGNFKIVPFSNHFSGGQPVFLPVNPFPSSYECVDQTPIKLRLATKECMCCKDGVQDPCIDDPLDLDCISKLPDHCFDIPIKRCVSGQNCQDPDFCKQAIPLNACGHITVISPIKANLVCCSDLGLGCDCPTTDPCETECCGPNCPGSEVCVNGQLLFPPGPAGLRQAQDEVWCNCWTVKAGISELTPNCLYCCCPEPESTPGDPNYPCDLLNPNNPQHQQLLQDGNCCECPSETAIRKECCECCLLFPDGERDPDTGECGFSTVICKPQIDAEVRSIFEMCMSNSGHPEPPPPFDCVNLQCPEDDEIISGFDNCSAVRHPDVITLNNGVGLVAYEDQDDVSVIKIKQFKTSILNKILANREFNFGRLENQVRWTSSVAKLYYYDSLPQHLLTEPATPIDPNDPGTWIDGVVFRNGPLAQQCFPVFPPAATDEIGDYINILIPTGTELTTPFPSSDDVYNVKWFLFDFEDTGVIGDATDDSTAGANYIINDRSVVDAVLQLPPHIYNNNPVPVAFPSIANAINYSNSLENSHFVYLVYQALEDGKWNVYLRQLRLSEYDRESQIQDQQDQLVPLDTINVGQVIYQIFCTNDTCDEISSNEFLLRRSVIMEVLLLDGREVFNNGLTGDWPSLCPGFEASNFPRNKVFVEFVHSVMADRCPDQFVFDQIFYNWNVGQEYTVPYSDSLSSSQLFDIMAINGDTAVALGQFETPIDVGGTLISSSSVGLVFYDDPGNATWSAISSSALDLLTDFKGIDIDEPILLTADEEGHSTRPVVRVNYKNEVFITYQNTETLKSQIKIMGTAIPTASLPVGYLDGRDIDYGLNAFFRQTDFVYRDNITSSHDGINEHPDMFIDLNDVIHLTWQSNRDKYWEIYYANSVEDFSHTRITNVKSKSLKPSITGSEDGAIFITWHDDRHGNYEIYLAFCDTTRIDPLFQQDPYLASFRNFSNGWSHTSDVIQLVITNEDSVSRCYTDFKVNFYEDRLLENLSFAVEHRTFPFAFHLPDLTNDTIVSEFNTLSSWSVITADSESPYGIESLATSPEIDTSLSDSEVVSVTLPSLPDSCQLETFEIRASNTQNDASPQWTSPVDISTLSGQTLTLQELGVSETVSGRYQQVRIKFICDSDMDDGEFEFTLTSSTPPRLCLPAGGISYGTLDITPTIRVDKLGNQTTAIPLPINYVPNRTYFIELVANNEVTSVTFPNLKQSVSCESCLNQTTKWNAVSCSLQIQVPNTESTARYYDVFVDFYYDRDRTQLINQLNTRDHITCFTVDNMIPAQNVWTNYGYRIPSGGRLDMLLWPQLSNTVGLVCGINYYVTVSICSSEQGENRCSESNATVLVTETWKCECQSARWDNEIEDAPINLKELVRWRSSGFGFSDTRLTETLNDSLNPIIRMRRNLNGIVIYETNRKETPSQLDSVYKIYASVFSVRPIFDMYASATEFITSPFTHIYHRSDVPICEGHPCFNDAGERTSPTLEGRSPSFAIDLFDSIFLAVEKPANQSDECNELKKGSRQTITVHRCGADAIDLYPPTEVESPTTQPCNQTELVGTSLAESNDPVFRSTIKMIRVNNDDVFYHITRGKSPSAVVKKCNIRLIIVGTPESVAVRLKNGSGSEWSEWYAFEPDIGENTMEIAWNLTPGSGVKTVDFQVSTYAGMATSASMTLIADYTTIPYTVTFFKPIPGSTPMPTDSSDPDMSDSSSIWDTDNIVQYMDGVPVTAIRPSEISDTDTITNFVSDYIFVEIVPSNEYLSQFTAGQSFEPSFDFIQQGKNDQFGITTILGSRDGQTVFRGKIIINREGTTTSKDGLAFIVPHFVNDCSDVSAISTVDTPFIRDKYNVPVSGVPKTVTDEGDKWKDERDELGFIKHTVTIRPNEDPYFIFGDPDYRLKRKDE